MDAAKRLAKRCQAWRFYARAYLDIGMAEIDPRLAELLLQTTPPRSFVGGTLEPRKLQRDLVVKQHSEH